MNLTKKTVYSLPGLCEERRALFCSLRLPLVFSARQAVGAYLAAGGTVPEVARAYGAMVAAGLVHDTGAVWQIARLAFAAQPEESGLRKWAETLGPGNWREAHAAADAAYVRAARAAARADHANDAHANDAHSDRADRASRAAYAAQSAHANAAHAAYVVAAAARLAAHDAAAREAQNEKIMAIIFTAIGE